MSRDLDQVIADARGELPVLRKHGQGVLADAIEVILQEVADASEDYRRFVSEADAILRSGHKEPWFRQRFAEWERQGHARRERGQRYYRLLIVPRRARLSASREAGRRAARRQGDEAE